MYSTIYVYYDGMYGYVYRREERYSSNGGVVVSRSDGRPPRYHDNTRRGNSCVMCIYKFLYLTRGVNNVCNTILYVYVRSGTFKGLVFKSHDPQIIRHDFWFYINVLLSI